MTLKGRTRHKGLLLRTHVTGNGRARPWISRKGTEKSLSRTPAHKKKKKKKTVSIYPEPAMPKHCADFYQESWWADTQAGPRQTGSQRLSLSLTNTLKPSKSPTEREHRCGDRLRIQLKKQKNQKTPFVVPQRGKREGREGKTGTFLECLLRCNVHQAPRNAELAYPGENKPLPLWSWHFTGNKREMG